MKHRIKKYADKIAFRLLATKKSVDQPWLEKELTKLCKECKRENKLTKSPFGLIGVCEGLGNWTDLNPWFWRIAFIITCSQSWVIYLMLVLTMKDDKGE